MSTLETTPFVDRPPIGEVPHGGPSETDPWRVSAIAGDILTLGTGTAFTAAFNTLLVFLIPRLVTVEQFGYWRLFLLYAGYVGFLHFGLPDGALLRWAGRPLNQFHHELSYSVRYLLWQHAILLLPACVVIWFVLPEQLRIVGVAVAIYAPIYNVTATLQFALQSARTFRPVAISILIPPAILLISVLAWEAKWQTSFLEITTFYLASWFLALGFLLAYTKPWRNKRRKPLKNLARQCISSGWPIVMANTGAMLIATSDRLALSWAGTIQNFAQYSLAASAMTVPITGIQACSKVCFSHLAAATSDARKSVYGHSSRLLLIAWTIALPYYFALDMFVRHFLPKYGPSLRYARILLLGIPFLAAILILQMSYAYLNGGQKLFLARTVAVLGAALGLSALVAFWLGSLTALAEMQVVIVGCWWFFNEWTLREFTGQSVRDWIKFSSVFVLVGLAYWLATDRLVEISTSLLIYYLIVGMILVSVCRADIRLALTRIRAAGLWRFGAIER